MAIINKIIKINKNNDTITSEFIEQELNNLGYENILRWAIVSVNEHDITVNFSSF